MSEQQKSSIIFNSFADWCLHKDSLCEAARHTVEVLLAYAGTSDIDKANRILSSRNELNMEFDQISDITPLQSLTNLTFLNLVNNEISDITALKSLTNLNYLIMNNNQVSDITALQSLTNLNYLILDNNQEISDITALQSLTNLTYLILDSNQVSDITALQSLTNLNYLSLNNNQVSDITALQSLTNLNNLNLDRNQISDITALQSLTNLTDLSLWDNQISDITNLQFLTNLTNLNPGRNSISDITDLQFLTNLTNLNLNSNQISDITALQSLTNLTNLNLWDNQISDITALQSLTNLTELHLYNNQISDITALQSLTNLTDLYLWDNQISDITALQSLTNLTDLNLWDNPISDITDLQFLTNLTNLDLGSSPISDFTAPQSLTNLTNLSLSFNLSPQQKAIIETCRHYWGSFANSTEPIDRAKASTAIQAICEILGLSTPEITFCSSPQGVLSQLQKPNPTQDNNFRSRLNEQIKDALSPFILIKKLERELLRNIEWEEHLKHPFIQVYDMLDYHEYLSIVTHKYLVKPLAIAEFCVSGLGIILKPESQKLLESLKQVLTECGWIFAFENVFYACDRPIKLSLDSQYRLHAEGASAIEFADGYKLYSYHGLTLPEKYGEIHPEMWRSQWILEENNAELRRVLIQGIGYARICQELQATELDCWQEYTLLRIDADIDGFNNNNVDRGFAGDDREPILLLKMTCPSTGFIHAMRVPPDMTSAREAIRWVNWDIEPEEFSVQT